MTKRKKKNDVKEVEAQKQKAVDMRDAILLAATPQFYDRGPNGTLEKRLSPAQIIKSSEYEQTVLQYHLAYGGASEAELKKWRRTLAKLRKKQKGSV